MIYSNKGPKQLLAAKFKSYCKHSSIHGVYYFNSYSRWWVSTLWTLIIVSSFTLCIYLSHMIWNKYADDPTVTVVESTHYSTYKIPFPAVTVCNEGRVYGPKTHNITKVLQRRGYNMSQIDRFYDSFSAIGHKDYETEPYVKKMHLLLEDLRIPFLSLLYLFKKPCDVLLVKCIWRSQQYDCASMFREVFTHAGYCCQFNVDHFKLKADKDINLQSGVEINEALEITVDGRKKLANGASTDGYVQLFIFDQHNKLTLADNQITMTPAGLFDININVWIIDSSDDVKALSINNRKCILKTDVEIGADYYEGCISMQILKKVVQYCRCIPFNYTYRELDTVDYPPCNWERQSCVHQMLDKTQADIRTIISQKDCYQPCDYIQYETEIEYIRQERNFMLYNRSFSTVFIHFGQTTCMKYRREVLYTWDQMLANLGGIFGLCLGGSIISVIEILWFILELIYTMVINLTKKKVTPEEDKKEKVFTLTRKALMSKDITKKKAQENDGHYKFVH